MYSDSTADAPDVGAGIRAAVDELNLAGLAVLPVQPGTKRPAVQWKDLQGRRPTEDQLAAWFAPDRLAAGVGVGAIMGTVSGGVELAEIEGRAVDRLPAIAEAMRASGLALLWKRLQGGWVETSPSRGVHWLYRLDLPAGEPFPGNQKIAQRPGPPAADDRPTVDVLAETRGEGGFCVLSPTDGSHHDTGRPWTRTKGGPLFPAVLTLDERDAFHAVLHEVLDEMPEAPVRTAPRTDEAARIDAYGSGLSPVDDFNARTDWASILAPHGWTHAYTGPDGTRYWHRPEKDRGQISATTDRPNEDGASRLYVWSTSQPLPTEEPLTKAWVQAFYEFGPDTVSKLAGRLRRDGYGDPLEGRGSALDLTGIPVAGEHRERAQEVPREAPEAAEGGEVDPVELLVLNELERLRVRREAARRLAHEDAPPVELPQRQNLAERLAGPRPDVKWRVDGLWPIGGRVNLAAASKAGKTTLISNLVRCLVDGDDFLDRFPVEPLPAQDGPSVVVFDFEMTEGQLLDWYEDQGIRAASRVDVVPLHGMAGAFDFLDPRKRRELVQTYRGAHTYVLDPVGPVIAALGLDENSNADVQRFLTTWDQFIRELGGAESFVAVHAGHNGERARGASAFLGSGDAIWTMVRDGDEASSSRYLRAIGRGVDLGETRLLLAGPRLTLGAGSRKAAKAQEKVQKAVPVALAALEKHGEDFPNNLWKKVAAEAKREEWEDWGVTRAAFLAAFPLAAKQGAAATRTVGKGTLYRLPGAKSSPKRHGDENDSQKSSPSSPGLFGDERP